MGFLLKEALRTLCSRNRWSYAIFWKIGCNNSKICKGGDHVFDHQAYALVVPPDLFSSTSSILYQRYSFHETHEFTWNVEPRPQACLTYDGKNKRG
ncbi:hypothetical protein JHK84_031376 [Glycine max]|nr:hypothetical protein JHK84_031376 [Glycine max]